MDHLAAARADCPVCGFRHAPIDSGLHRVRDRLAARGAIPIQPRDDRPAWLRRSESRALMTPTGENE